MCIKYKTIFKNNYFTENSEVVFYGQNYCQYVSPVVLQNIVIEANAFEVLTIDYREYFNHENLSKFDYEKNERHGCYVLKNYVLKTFVPINVVDKKCGNESMAEMIIELQNKNNRNHHKLKMFDKEVAINEND